MKVTIYIEKRSFDTFFTWLNRINQGVISHRPTRYSTCPEGFTSPLQITLSGSEYATLQDVEADLARIKEEIGAELHYTPEPMEQEKIMVNAIIKKAQRHDALAELVISALELASYLQGITPLEALVIAEGECIHAANEKTEETGE